MTSCLSLLLRLLWCLCGRYVLPSCALSCDKPLWLLPRQTLQVLCSSGIPSMSCKGPQEREGSACCVQSIAMWSVTTSGDTWRFLQRTPKRTAWTSEEGHNPSLPLFEMTSWGCAAVCQAGVHPWSSCWARLSTLWAWLPTSSRSQARVGSLHAVFSHQLVVQDVWGPLGWEDKSQAQTRMCWGDPVSHRSCCLCGLSTKNSTALLAGCYCYMI